MSRKSGQILTFALTFFITLAALCGAVAAVFAAGDFSEEKQSAETLSEAEYLPLYEHEQNILFICCDWRGGAAKLFGIVKINPVKQRFNIAILPPQTVSTVNIRTDTLAGHYDYGGSLMAIEAAQNACGVKINRYVKFALEDMYEIIDRLGGVEYDVKKAAGDVEKGFQTLDGRRIFELIFAQEGAVRQSHLATDMFVKIANTSLKSFLTYRSDEFFKLVTERSDTSLTAFDYEFRREAIAYIVKENRPGDGVKISGNYDGENDEFTLSEQALTHIQSVFWLSGSR